MATWNSLYYGLLVARIGSRINAFCAQPDFKRLSVCELVGRLNSGSVVGIERSHNPGSCSVGIQDANLIIAQCKSSSLS